MENFLASINLKEIHNIIHPLNDSLAQWIMAAAAFFGLIISIIVAEFIRRTLLITRGLLQEAKITTTAAIRASSEAEKAYALTEKNGQIDQRAWVIIQDFAIEKIARNSENHLQIDFRLTITNTGKTPARYLTCESAARGLLDNNPKFGDEFLAKLKESKKYGGHSNSGTLGPGEVREFRFGHILQKEELISAKIGTNAPGFRFKVTSGVIYNTVFSEDEKFTFKMAMILGPDIPETGEFSRSNPPFIVASNNMN